MSPEEAPKNTESRDEAQEGIQRQQKILAACTAGNLDEFRQLLAAAGAKPGDAPIEPTWSSYPSDFNPVPSSGPPATSTLLAHAVIHARINILAHLLAIYPTAPVNTVLGSALAHPDLATFKLLHARDPSIVNHEFEDKTTALMTACRDGAVNPLLPTFLLEHGADPNESGLGLTGPLVFAVQYGQPLSLIKKMVDKGARVTTASINVALRDRRFDVARYFLEKCRIDNEQDLEKLVQKDVSECGSKEVKKAFDRRMKIRARRG